MIENNSNEEVLVNEKVLKEENSLNNDVVEYQNNELKDEGVSNIEILDDTTVFTPIVSDFLSVYSINKCFYDSIFNVTSFL